MKNNSPYLAGARRSAAGMTTSRRKGQQVMQAHQTQHLKRKTEAQIWQQEKFRLLLKLSVGLTPGVIPYLPSRRKGEYWHNVLYRLLAPTAIVTSPPEPPLFGHNSIQIWKSQIEAPIIDYAIIYYSPEEKNASVEIRWNRNVLIPRRPYTPRLKVFNCTTGDFYNSPEEQQGNYPPTYRIFLPTTAETDKLLYICWYEISDGSPSKITSDYATPAP